MNYKTKYKYSLNLNAVIMIIIMVLTPLSPCECLLDIVLSILVLLLVWW